MRLLEVMALRARVAELEARVASYEHRISWHTTCANCANLLDASISYYEKVTELEAERDEWKRLTLYAFHLAQYGENAPGGNETWRQFEMDLRMLEFGRLNP